MSRHNTVFDLGGLRLHPDGGRVPQSTSAVRAHKTRAAVRDLRGNWIAQDAGGARQVKKRRGSRKREPESEGEAFEFSGVNSGDSDEGTRRKRKAKGKAREVTDEPEPERISASTRKRRKVANDFTYLDGREETQDQGLPKPSAEMLTWIHRFTSTYYSQRGQLSDASRIYRRQKEQRRLKRLEKEPAGGSDDDGKSSATNDEEYDKNEQDSDRSTSKEKEGRPLAKDMYKLMDGSGLMAVGMLLQEHLVAMLTARKPHDWEEVPEEAG